MITPRTLLCVAIAILALAPLGFSSATDVFITPNGSSVSGSVCTTNTQSPAWFNNSSNWGSGANQIGSGTTVHLCGTFNMPAGTVCALSFQGSGSSSGQITLLFDANALASAPYWTNQSAGSSGNVGGFICSNGFNYLTIDGGTNGTIQATANGASLGNNNSGAAICMSGSSNSEVKNVTIANMYVAVKNSSANGNNTYAIVWMGGSNVSIDNNVTHDCRWCIQYWYPGSATSSNLQIFNNTIYNTDHCIAIGDGDGDSILNGTNRVYGNVCHDWALFDNGGADHHDGFHVWAVHSGSVITDIKVYNNYIYGDIGQAATAYLYSDVENGDSVTSITMDVFNNILVNTSSSDDESTGGGGDGLFFCQGSSTCNVYNNTFVGASNSANAGGNAGIQTETTTGVPKLTVKNNIFSTLSMGVDTSQGATISSSDYNIFYNMGTGSGSCSGGCAYRTSSGGEMNLAAWQASSGSPDAHSTTNSPSLSATYMPQSGSAAIGLSLNLTGMGITPLDSDKVGNPRASSGSCTPGVAGCWDTGAYLFQSAGQAPSPPSGLTATVN